MSNETKIGILAVVAIAALIWGYQFLKGQNILSASRTLYAKYTDVDMLKSSNPVLLHGLEAGVVTEVQFKDKSMDTILVAMRLDKGINVPNNAVAVIVDQGMMGGKAVELILGVPCDDKFPCPTKENYVRGETQSYLKSILGSPKELNPYFKEIADGLGIILDTIGSKVDISSDDKGLGKTINDFQQTLANLNAATRSLENLLNSSSRNIDAITENLAAVTGNLKGSNTDIQDLFGNAADFTGNLKEIELKETISSLNTTVEQLGVVLDSVSTTFSNLNTLTSDLNNGEGTVGQLLTDEALYFNLNEALVRMDSLFTDIQQHPYIYSPLKKRKRVLRYRRKDAEEGR